MLEGGVLVHTDGALKMPEILEHLDRRVAQIPKLKQRIHRPGRLRGRPVWVDDPRFDIRNHVRATTVAPPGGTTELLAAAATAYGSLLDRRRPLWELWFLTGGTDGRIGALLKLHHAVADGLAAVAMMSSLFDLDAATPDPGPNSWQPSPPPRNRALLVDNLAAKARALRTAAAALTRPGPTLDRGRRLLRTARGYAGQSAAPGSSLNQPVQAGRRIQFLTLEVAAMKDVAHSCGGTLNDVVLDLWAGGLRHLLAARGEPTAGLQLVTAVAASVRSAAEFGAADNRVGTLVMPLQVGESDPRRRLEHIVSTTRATKAAQRPGAILGFLAALAGTPIGRYYATHQRANNVVVTNVTGPPEPVYLLGARVGEILPIIEILGNIGLTLCAFSYTGRVFLVVTADAAGFPDLDVLTSGMQQDWDGLLARRGPPT